MRISIIVAASENNVIGNHGALPWKLPKDMKHFRELTEGHSVIMGRKTYASIGHALPKRRNIVVSRQAGFFAEGCDAASSFNEAVETAEKTSEIFIIGGGELYRDALSHADRIYLTRVHAEIEGDVFFPEIDSREWREAARERHEVDAEHAYPFSFITYERKHRIIPSP